MQSGLEECAFERASMATTAVVTTGTRVWPQVRRKEHPRCVFPLAERVIVVREPCVTRGRKRAKVQVPPTQPPPDRTTVERVRRVAIAVRDSACLPLVKQLDYLRAGTAVIATVRVRYPKGTTSVISGLRESCHRAIVLLDRFVGPMGTTWRKEIKVLVIAGARTTRTAEPLKAIFAKPPSRLAQELTAGTMAVVYSLIA